MPVAVLTSDVFDAATVAPSTVTLGDGSGTDTPALRSHLGDINGDGRADLVLHFSTAALAANDLTPLTTELRLRGETFGGNTIEGTDTVRVVP